MATQTPLRHPDENAQTGQFYPYTVKISLLNVDGTGTQVLQLPCAYDAATGSMPEEFQDEAPAMDRILINGWHPEIPDKGRIQLLHSLLPPSVFSKWFVIADKCPVGQGADGPQKTLLLASPPEGE